MASMNRDDFPERVKDVLAKRVGLRCSNPACRQTTSGPHLDPARSVSVGVAAHITGAARKGPRYDASLNSVQRSAITNAVWLCQDCAKLVDSDTNRFTVDLLLEWKAAAEQESFIEIVGKNFDRHYPSSPAAVHSPIPKIHGLAYDAARSLLIDSGWQPLMHHWSHGSDPEMIAGNGKYFWDKGYREIRHACPNGLAHCLFIFTDVYGNRLIVGTSGEVYPEFGATATVRGWHFEQDILPVQQIQVEEITSMAITNGHKVSTDANAQKQPISYLSSVKSVYVTNGNLFISDEINSSRQITFAGIDSAPYLSTDKNELIFLRDYGDLNDENKLNQIWSINLSSFKEECILTAGQISNRYAIIPKNYIDTFGKGIGQIYKAIVSQNSCMIYFLARAWATSGAIFSFNRRNKRVKFLSSGNFLDIISKGNFTDKLITSTHKYNLQDGSYDFYYI